MEEKEQLYTQWLAYHRTQITPPEGFSKNVMGAIGQASIRNSAQNDMTTLQERLQHPLYQWAAASGLVLLGLFRIFYIAGSLFRTNLVMP